MDRLAEELSSQSPWSPGLVKDDETLLRLGFAPEHVLDGEVIVSAISQEDLLRRGYSVDRKLYVDLAIMRSRAAEQMRRRPAERQEAFVASLQTGSLRRLTTFGGERAFVVVDSALRENHAHASILSAKKRSPSQIKALKALLVPHLQNPRPLADYLASFFIVEADTVTIGDPSSAYEPE